MSDTTLPTGRTGWIGRARVAAVLLGLVLVLVGGGGVGACSASSGISPSAPPDGAVPVAPPPVAPISAADAGRPEEAPAPAPVAKGPLAHFRERLAQLGKPGGPAHVRVAVYGDSHIEADFLTGELRRVLQARFGDGGPGFMHLGSLGASFRHDGVRRESFEWRVEPRPPTALHPSGDGVFGLAGVRFASLKRTARARITLGGTPARVVAWDVAVRSSGCTHGDAARVVAESTASDGGTERAEAVLPCSAGAPGVAPPPSHIALRTSGAAPSFALNVVNGTVELQGLVAESEQGVVVDGLGIIGARASTLLTRDADVMRAELARRAYDLVAVAYGTNESISDIDGGAAYGVALAALLERFHAALPNAECLVVGPPDRGERRHALPASVLDAFVGQAERVATSHGCAWFDARAAMGGRGGFDAWARATPRLASADHVHLSAAGYRKLGGMLAGALVGAAP